MTNIPAAEDAWANDTDPEKAPDKATAETGAESVPAPVQASKETDEDGPGFLLSTADVVALINDRTAEQLSVSTFRTLVSHDQGPQPLSWGKTPVWAFATVEDWISEMFASGSFTMPEPDTDGEEEPGEEAKEPELIFGSTAQWVETFLAPMYRRDIAPNGAGALVWCPSWWMHSEAVIRLEALWRAWEHLRLDGKTGVSVFMKDHLDHHMAVLMDGKGPFDGCSLDFGHKPEHEGLRPLPVVTPPAELFPDVRTANTETKDDNDE